MSASSFFPGEGPYSILGCGRGKPYKSPKEGFMSILGADVRDLLHGDYCGS
ncbi:MAG: hypothetical protein QW304_08640 [Thermoproteota archaeon]